MSKLNIDQKSVKALFSEKKADFLIPDYQRPYAWGEKECQTLWDDLFLFAFPENDCDMFNSDSDEYFLGPIVTFKNSNGKMEIIDGQQRLTTLMLLLRAFYEKYGSMKNSVLNLAVWRWLFLLLQQHFSEPTPFFWLINTILVFATGGITGAVIGILRAKNTVRRLFEHFNINYRHPIPTAWDYKFSDGKSYWVEVFLSNDKVIRGLYSGRSFASSDDEHRDIFIEHLYEKHNDAWVRVERTAGVLISPDEIRYIKFFELEENNNEQRSE